MKKSKKIPLSTLRMACGLSQKELADKLDCSASTIGMYESGRRTPSLGRAQKIAEFFNKQVDDISFTN